MGDGFHRAYGFVHGIHILSIIANVPIWALAVYVKKPTP